jgi:hypothetical protein
MSITLPTTKNHGWIDASRELGPAPVKGIGQVKNPDRRMVVSDLNAGRHATCVDHVEVDGLRHKVCVGPGQKRADVIAEARELAGAE